MEARLNQLELVVADLSNQMEEQKQTTSELLERLVAQMSDWKNEIAETIRLNRPQPPILSSVPGGSSVNGARRDPPAYSHHRPGKAPAAQTIRQDEVLEGAESDSEIEPAEFAMDWTRRKFQRPVRDSPLLRYRYDFPAFDYEHPRLWISRCERFFLLAYIPKIEIMHVLYVNLTGKIGLWFEGYLTGLDEPFQWTHFAEAVVRRFGEDSGVVMEEIAYFRQIGGVMEFTDKFEEFRSQLIQKHPTLTDLYFLEAYLARLKPHLRCFVKTSQPKCLADAMWTARQLEKGLKFNEQPTKNPAQYIAKNSQPITNLANPKPYSQNTNSKPYTSQGATTSSGSNSSPGHKCKGSTLHNVEENEFQDANDELATEEPGEEPAEVSLYAMMGGEGLNTIKLLGAIQRQPIVILVDSGSTHSFLDPKLLTQLRMESEKAQVLSVTVANGEQLWCDAICRRLSWQMQGEMFMKDFRLLKLGGCNMVLGMDWIDQYAPIQLHTRPLGLSFYKDGKKLLLKGLGRKSERLQAASSSEIKKWEKNGVQGFLVHCEGLNNETLKVRRSMLNQVTVQTEYQELSELIQEFQDLFKEAETLPPRRLHDHAIPLMPGAQAVNIKPYRYSFDQKNVIEEMVGDMLKSGVITESVSPFASPVLLVPKKDNTWRFCVDYRALNNITIKNKFPIPVVEDLFSELVGSKYFSKLDLRAGYHQVRMREGEEYKTAFKTHQGLYEFRVMPFGLTNAPATFQALMNVVFKPLLRKFVLVFFYDILVYSAELELHWEHLRRVLELMREHKLLAKLSKCSFVQKEVEYLGHIIFDQGLHTDPSKLQAIAEWPKPESIKALRGFLGLTGYYRRFIRAYGVISRPLTSMLKKNSFQWNKEAENAFDQLKQALCVAPVLALPDFQKTFIVEADACHKGMRAVLIQEEKPIAYFSKAFGEKHLGLSIYEKEFMAIINAVEKWRSYLLGRHFIIRTDHHSLKFLLDQKITTSAQQKGLSKLLGLHYTIQYKKGSENCVADALSRREVNQEAELKAVLSIRPQWMEEVANSYEEDDWAQDKLTASLINPSNDPNIAIVEGLIRCKSESVASPGFLQPLAIPDQAWKGIAMDFIEGLPRSQGKDVILVYIVTDRDRVFLSKFWQAIFKQLQVHLSMSTAYHPQSDGQTERINRCLETYLRCMVFSRPKAWAKWLHLAEYWYNTNFHSSLQCTPFQALYGYKPPMLALSTEGEVGVEGWMAERAAMLAVLKDNLKTAQERMKQQADRKRSERILQVGDWVYLKIQPYRQLSVAIRSNIKLTSKYYGPYQVIEKVGPVAYRLDLPTSAQIHPVFHVSQLKKKVGNSAAL
ncbi:PREDICTED: uncharacterized protein LOC109193863 [Ipomoea nil]|uniref:uncharacterized protein LOC109193863 n=1 Tax=Ipomoea nil TaxID=35883 RepID=UPI000900A79A|nr:PREDICTED: uncharacterized protein LOC109193863 [Ipomoea nil]